MAIIPQSSLFGWEKIEAASDLDRLKLVLSVLPDEPLMRKLEELRGKGRNDYPIRATWNAVLAGIVFQHPSVASLRRELLRNGELRQLCGFDPMLGAKAVPTDDAFSNFLGLLLKHQEELVDVFHALLRGLAEVLPDLGENLACDSKALWSFGRPVKDENKREKMDRRRDVDADVGVKVYRGKRKDGSNWEKIVRWFGYKLHLLVDSTYELPVAFEVTRASENDSPHLIPLVKQNKERNPRLAERARKLAADKGYDSEENNRVLYDDFGIKPIIDKRDMWKEEPQQPRVLFWERYDAFSFDEHGKVYCTCPVTGEQRELFFHGFERGRGTLKYRCPAAACGITCKGRKECESLAPCGVSKYGRVVRIPLEYNRRIFTPIARHTQKWQKEYERRTAVERVNSRLDRVLGFEEHTIRGLKKMRVRVTLALTVMLAMALGRIRQDQKELMRSLTAPVKRKAA